MKFANASATFALISILAASGAYAESAWVSDEFEITLRSGPSTSNAIQLMVSSGMQLEVLERDADSGYTRVRTPGGTEGWVLTRYLMNEASAREQLQALSSQLSNANTLGSSLDTQLSSIKGEYDSAQRQIQNLEREKAALEQELSEIKRTAANVLTINDENKRQRDQISSLGIQVDVLEEENRQLSSERNYHWFVAGAGVLIFGAILGLVLPRFKWRRRSRYDRL